MTSQQRIAITGSTGFIGQHTLKRLRALGCEVVAGVRRVEVMPKMPGVRFVPLDIYHPSSRNFELLGKPDILIHLAWGGLPNYHSLTHINWELHQQRVFLKSILNHGLGSLLIAGTCAEYGTQSGLCHERLPTQPVSAYGYAKDMLRIELDLHRKIRPFELTWARIFYTFGEGQASTSLLPQIEAAALSGEPSFELTNGNQFRDYLPVDRVAEKLVLLALRPQGAGIVNVCSGVPIRVRAFAETWVKERKLKINLNDNILSPNFADEVGFWGDNSYFASLFV